LCSCSFVVPFRDLATKDPVTTTAGEAEPRPSSYHVQQRLPAAPI